MKKILCLPVFILVMNTFQLLAQDYADSCATPPPPPAVKDRASLSIFYSRGFSAEGNLDKFCLGVLLPVGAGISVGVLRQGISHLNYPSDDRRSQIETYNVFLHGGLPNWQKWSNRLQGSGIGFFMGFLTKDTVQTNFVLQLGAEANLCIRVIPFRESKASSTRFACSAYFGSKYVDLSTSKNEHAIFFGDNPGGSGNELQPINFGLRVSYNGH